MFDTIKFSIIIPVYNVAPYLRECLDSVLAQTFTDWEAICVDDGSTDGSGAILDEYAAKDKRIIAVHTDNAGPGPARNRGMEFAQGEWLCFLDGDDLVRADWLEHCHCVIADFPDVDMVRHEKIEFNERDKISWPVILMERIVWDLRKTITEDVIGGAFWARIYRRSKVANVRFPPYRPGQDWAWKVDAILKMDSMVDIGEVLYGYRQRMGSTIHSERSLQWHQSSLLWRVHVLESLCQQRGRICASVIRWASLGITEGYFSEFSESKCKELLWPFWLDVLRRVAIIRCAPCWFRFSARIVAFSRSHFLAFLLFRVPNWLKQKGIHRL